MDGSPLAESAIVLAAYLIAALAAPAQGALHLAQVVNLPTVQREDENEQRDLDVRAQAQYEATTYLSTVADTLSGGLAAVLGLKITWSVTVNEDVADALIRMAELGEDIGSFEIEGCDLITIATHGRGAFQRWIIGSITERVLDGTQLPLLIVRPQERSNSSHGASLRL